MTKVISMGELRSKMSTLPDFFRRGSGRHSVTVTRRGRPILAILPIEEYEAMVETLEVLSDEETMQLIRQGLEDIEKGKLIPMEEVMRKEGGCADVYKQTTRLLSEGRFDKDLGD